MSGPPVPDPWQGDPDLGDTVKANFHHVTIDVSSMNKEEAIAWASELQNVFADMEIENVSVVGNQISFEATISGMDEVTSEDIKMKLEEYSTMSEAFSAKNINVE